MIDNQRTVEVPEEVYQKLLKDKKRLDKLQKLTKGYGRGWCLRDSFYGRGMRLHETSSNRPTFKTVREAIDLY